MNKVGKTLNNGVAELKLSHLLNNKKFQSSLFWSAKYK